MADATKQQLETRLANLRKKLKVSTAHAEAAAGAAGHEVVFYGGLAAFGWASGYWGSDYATFWGIDFRPVVGLGLQLAGLAALAWGMPMGRWGITVGRAPVAAWLGERSRAMGAAARDARVVTLDKNGVEVGAVTQRQISDANHPMHADVQVTRSPELAY